MMNSPGAYEIDQQAAAGTPQTQPQPGQQPGAEPVQPDPKNRPEVPQDIQAQVKQWFVDTDNLTQRANALWEFREAQKTLFPARFNPNDPRRGQTPFELRSGKDNRRVQTPYIFRDSLQTTAMSVPEDLTFKWNQKPQVQPPPNPMIPTQIGIIDPAKRFAETLTIVQLNLLEEAGWIEKCQAIVQDGSLYPMAILKHTFHRDYQTSSLSATPLSKDATDTLARLTSLLKQFTSKEFDENSAQYAHMMDLLKSTKSDAEITRFIGIILDVLPMDGFGICEDAMDLVNIYDASWMFHDALITGDEILARYPYYEGEDGKTYGVIPSELTDAVAWDTNMSSTDPNSRNRASRNRQLTAPKATVINISTTTNSNGVDPKKRKYVVREVWCKATRTVHTIVRGLNHYVDCVIPQKTSERWYPFTVYCPNRVPTEIYGVSDLELKRDIQARIHRKRTDEEKARYLSIDRYIYNTADVDSKEIIKLGDIPPAQFKGINLGHTQKLTDSIMPLSHAFKPESFDTTKDERDKDMMGALPAQALGATGTANFATEVSVASQGATIATTFRQSIIRRTLDGMLTCLAEILVQELTREEVQRIAGPFAEWPDFMTDAEADSAVQDAQQRAMQIVSPLVLQAAVGDMQIGIPIDPQSIQKALETQAAPVWQQEMIQKYGNIEPLSRTALYSRMKVKVKSSLISSLDRQQRIQSLGMLSGAILQLAQTAQATGQPFNPRPLLKNVSMFTDDEDLIDEMFPAIPPMDLAAQQVQQAAGAAAGSGPPGQQGQGPTGGPPNMQGGQGQQANNSRQPSGPAQQSSPGAPTPDKAGLQ